MRALVIDDSRAIRGIIAKILRSLDFETSEACDGREAWDLLQREGPFDVVTVNWEMPVMDGLQFVAKVRRDPRYRALPLLMISSESDGKRVDQALGQGVDQYLFKPCTQQSVATKLAAMGLNVPGDATRDTKGASSAVAMHARSQLPRRGEARPKGNRDDSTPREPGNGSGKSVGVSHGRGISVGQSLGGSRAGAGPSLQRNRIRVLLVDDSAVVRRIVKTTLEDCGGFEVVGGAADGVEGLEMIHQLSPDVVLLDVDMPRMDGLELLKRLREQRSAIPVVMFSSRTERGAKTTTDALLLGAKDFVFKPGGARMADQQAGREAIRDQIAPRLRWLTRRSSSLPGPIRPAARSESVSRIDLVVVAASTGGPAALATLLHDSNFRAALHAPVLIVQHMPTLFTRYLASRLAEDTQLDVAEATAGEMLKPGMIRIAPGGQHLAVSRKGLALFTVVHDGPAVNSCRPSADVLFLSAAEVAKAHLLAVMLTGMGHDGRDGCRAIRQAGGWIVAQDEPTSVVWGMPGSVVKEGLADQVLPIERIGYQIACYLRSGRK